MFGPLIRPEHLQKVLLFAKPLKKAANSRDRPAGMAVCAVCPLKKKKKTEQTRQSGGQMNQKIHQRSDTGPVVLVNLLISTKNKAKGSQRPKKTLE